MRKGSNKFLAIFLGVLLLLSIAVPAVVLAEDANTLALQMQDTHVNVDQTDTVEVSYSITENAGFCDAKLIWTFNSSVLELISAVSNNDALTVEAKESTPGRMVMLLSLKQSTGNFTQTGKAFTLRWKLKAADNVSLALSADSQAVSYEYKYLQVKTTVPGTFTVHKGLRYALEKNGDEVSGVQVLCAGCDGASALLETVTDRPVFFYSGEALKTVQNKVSVPVQVALNPGFSSASLPLILPEGVTVSSVQGSEGMNAVLKGNTLELTAASAVSGNGLALTLNLDFSGVKNSQETGYDIAFGRATADSASAYGIAFSVSHQYYSNPDVIRVTVNWGTMEFEYDDGQWNTDTHVWENAGWKSSGNTVELINEGNVSVRAGLSYDAAEGYEGINGSFTNEAGNPVEEEILLSPNGTNKSYFHLDGSTGNRWTESVAIGHITVTLK